MKEESINKKIKIITLSFVVLAVTLALYTANASHLTSYVRGRILLQVESFGEAWYVNPADDKRYYMKDGGTAYEMMRSFGLGITDSDLAKIPVGFEDRFEDIDVDGDGLADKLEDALGTELDNADTDGDGYLDGEEVRNGYNPLGSGKLSFDTKFVDKLRGKILLQVESRGEAWYVNVDDGKRYYMKNGQVAYQIMRFLSLGISNSDLESIPQSEFFDIPPSGTTQSVDPLVVAPPVEISNGCVKVAGHANQSSMNIFFIGVGYDGDQIYCNGECSINNFDRVLENDINRFLYNESTHEGYGILTIEPFASQLDKVNVYMLEEPYNCDVLTDIYCYTLPAKNLVEQMCDAYISSDPIYAIIGYEDPATYGVGGGGYYVSANHRKGQYEYEDTVSTFIHEIGHNFGLHDLYSNAYQSFTPNIMNDSYSVPNCDNTAGCPKWCNGEPEPPFETICTSYNTEEECSTHSGFGEFCLWLTEVDPYFNSQCIKNIDISNTNIGNGCIEGTGCYLGCDNVGYRAIPENNFADRFSQSIDGLGKKHTFEPVSERFVSDIFSCCYPSSCSDYNQSYCTEFAQRYPEYNTCNVCEQTNSISKPVITSPTEGELATGDTFQVKGKTKAGYYVWGYKSSDQTCITFNHIANGGASQADGQGNFIIDVPSTSLTEGQWTYFVAALPESRTDGCYSEDNLSKVVNFQYSID